MESSQNLRTFKTLRVPKCTSKFIRFVIYYIFSKIIPSPTLLLRVVRARILQFLGFFFLSVAYVCQTFNQVCASTGFWVFFFSFSSRCSASERCFGLTKQTDCPLCFFFSFGLQIQRFPVFLWQLPSFHCITSICTL